MKKHHGIVVLFLFSLVLNLSAQEDQVIFSSPGGFYDDPFPLSLSCLYADHVIRYTVNGSTPTAKSTIYETPLIMDERCYSHSDIYTIPISPPNLIYVPDSVKHAIVIRAAVFANDGTCVSDTYTNTYLIRSLGCDETVYPVVSICADSLDLFSEKTGIFVPGIHWNPNNPEHTGNYYQRGRDWERQVNVEFYEPADNTGINQRCGLRTHGNRSRRYPSKGMKIYAREEYGKKRFKHQFFKNSPLKSFKHLILKPFASFEPFSGVQDYFCNRLSLQIGLDAPLCRPVLVYLNGEYWGVYFIQEKTDERFLEDHHDVDINQCNIIGSWWGEVESGTGTSFQQMMKWFANTDLSNDTAYEQACSIIDVQNFIDYNVFETFVGNWDWPGNNMRCWQENNGLWRWMFFDGDATLMENVDVFENAAVYTPPATWINYPEAKLLLGKLLQNDKFKRAFKTRAMELCDGPFQFENTYPILHDMVETLRPKIHDQRHRFGYPPTDELWNHGNKVIHDFLMNRVEQYLTTMNESDLFETDEAFMPVQYSVPGGFYESSPTLSLQCAEGRHIRYTTDGSIPSAQSALYTEPLTLDESMYSESNIYTIVDCLSSNFYLPDDIQRAIVIRTAVFDENDSCVSPVFTNSYFIRDLGCDFHGLPVLSIVTDSLSLFDYETGIFIPGIHFDPADSTHTGNYYQRGRAWERQVNMEFYEPDNSGINQACGLRTHGGKSRRYQQKGMRLYAREDYGKKRFKHRFFEAVPNTSFKRLNLHPFRCSHWLHTGGQEYLSQTIASNLDIETLAVRQTVVFINGEYWGVYTLEESPDERYLEDHFDVDLEKVNIIKYWTLCEEGDSTDWTQFYSWLRDADLRQPYDSAYAYSRIDVGNFIDYVLFETFSANLDWPQNNVLQWQSENGEPFRWIFFDGDGCFTRLDFNALNNAIHQGGNSLVFNRFLENQHFRTSFINRYYQLSETAFSHSYMTAILDRYRHLVEGEIPAQSERFHFPTSIDKWRDDMELVEQFLLNRHRYYADELRELISVSEQPMPGFSCSPNPCSGSFYLHFDSQVTRSTFLEIFDIRGVPVYTKEIFLSNGENNILVQSELSPGLYLIRLDHTITLIVIQ